jgi:hypothetical protein
MTEFNIIKTGLSKDIPAKIVLYGVPKIGKSRFASNAEGAFFINIEDGLQYLGKEVAATPVLKTFEEVIDWLNHLLKSDTDTKAIKTIVVDSLDWLENLAQNKIVKAYGGKSIVDPQVKDFAYYKGVQMAAEETLRALHLLDRLYKEKQIRTILIAHTKIKEMDLPGKDNYSKYLLKLSTVLAGRVNEWADLTLFADMDFFVDKDGKPSEPKPTLFTGNNASFEGGGRMKLKHKIPLDYAAFTKELTTI